MKNQKPKQNQKKNQQEKLRSKGIKNPRPITNGYKANGRFPIARNGSPDKFR